MITVSETKDSKIIAELNSEVQDLHAKLHPDIFKPFNKPAIEKVLESQLADPNCRAFVARKENVAIGYILCFIKETGENAFHHNIKTIYIDQVSVLKQYQRSGAGKLLLEEVEKLAKKLFIHKIELDHWTSNVTASRYFRKNGFEFYKERLFKTV